MTPSSISPSVKLPLSWLFFIMAPQLAGVVISWESYDASSLLFNLMWLLFACSSVSLFLGRAAVILISVTCAFLGLSELLHWLALDGPISIPSIYVVLESNLEETESFSAAHFSPLEGAVVFLYVVIGAYLLKAHTRLSIDTGLSPKNAKRYMLAFSLLIGYRTYTGHSHEVYPSTLYALALYQQQMSAYREAAEQQKAGERRVEAQALSPGERETLVLVIGESTNRHRMSLYGYHRQTSPRLEALRSELSIFTDVVSSHSNTRDSLQHALTTLEVGAQMDFYEAASVIQLAQAAGYEVHWISNQVPIGVWDNVISVMASTANTTTFVNMTGTSKKALASYSYDEKVLPHLAHRLTSSAEKKLIIVHLLGAHSTYAKRYPARFDRFKPDHLLRQSDRMYAAYDNALLYNDHVIAEVIELARQSDVPGAPHAVAMLYFADHGEEVYDVEHYHGHAWTQLTAHMVDVPFLVWMSDTWRKTRPEDEARVRSAQGRSFMLDQLIHPLLTLLRVRFSGYDPHRDVLSPEYQPQRRVVHGVDYDDLRVKTDELRLKYSAH